LLLMAQQSAVASNSHVGAVLFYAFASLTALSAWAIVLSSNIVRMSIYLLFTLGGVAGIYFMLNAEILAAIQLIVYAGGTLILIIFGVMLTSKNPFMQLKVKGWETFAAIGVAAVMMGMLVWAMVNSDLGAGTKPVEGGYSDVANIGRGLLSKYLVPFEVAGVLLLVVMIGAAYMARKRRVE
jgi:NADH:ubiquinone oxidoreductase subunit 6 (subunit J)